MTSIARHDLIVFSHESRRTSRAMQVQTILHQLLSTAIHKTRVKGLIPVLQAVIKSKKLQLTQLGRALKGKAKERSGIRLIDKLLSNPYL